MGRTLWTNGWQKAKTSIGGEQAPEPGDPSEDPFCSFWKGNEARVCAELCTVLDEAGIPHKTIHRSDHLFNLNHQAGYQLGVPASLYEKAELAVKEAFGTDEADRRGCRAAFACAGPRAGGC
jgi:hypothetical protein